MDHSLIGASAATHFKVVVAALVGATLVVTVGIASRLADADSGGPASASPPVVKADHVQAYTTRDGFVLR